MREGHIGPPSDPAAGHAAAAAARPAARTVRAADPRPVRGVRRAIGASVALARGDRDWLLDRCEAYDATGWEGYPVLRDMRELQTLTAVPRNAHRDRTAHEELRHRLASLRAGDDRLWHALSRIFLVACLSSRCFPAWKRSCPGAEADPVRRR